MEQKIKTASNVPMVDDEIYVTDDYFGNIHLYVGGRAKVSRVRCSKICGIIVHMIEVEGRPFINYNWEQYLSERQEKLREKFCNKFAEPRLEIKAVAPTTCA